MRKALVAIAFLGLLAARLVTPAAAAPAAPVPMGNPERVAQTPPVPMGNPPAAPAVLPPAEPLDGARCGDFKCTPPEDCNTCPQDCGKCCGDGKCSPPEDCNTCPQDCGKCK